MTLARKVKETIRGFRGQRSAIPFGVLESPDAALIRNFIIRKGKLQKIWGFTKYAEPVLGGSGGVLWIDRFRQKWLFQHGAIIGIEDSEESATFSALISGLTTLDSNSNGDLISLRVRSEKWKSKIFLVNGKEKKFYDGSNVYNIGLTPPGDGQEESAQSDVTLSQANSSGTLVDTTVYKYLITWWDDDRQIESLPNGAIMGEDGLWTGNNPAQITIAAPSDTVTIDVTNLKADGYDTDRVSHFIVYRALVTAGVTGTFKRISNSDSGGLGSEYPGIFRISLNSTTDGDPSETTLGLVLDETISPPPDGEKYLSNAGTNSQGGNSIGPRFIKQHRDQLWLFGVELPGNDVPFSPLRSVLYASEVDNFDYYPFAYSVDKDNEENDTGLAIFRNTLLIFKSKSIHYVDGTAPENYVIRRLDKDRGCIAPGSLQETPVGAIALSADGFILCDGAGPAKLISDFVFDELSNLNNDALEKITSGYNKKDGKYECHVPLSPSTNNTLVFVYDINESTWQFLKGREGQAVVYDLDKENRHIGLMGDSLNSSLYEVLDETAVTFNGQTIRAKWSSKHFDFGHPELQKRLCFIKIKAKARVDFKISIDIIPDFGQQPTITIPDIESESAFDQWDTGLWDQAQWAGDFIDRKIEVIAEGIARNFQIVIREAETDADRAGFQIEEIVLEANLLGR